MVRVTRLAFANTFKDAAMSAENPTLKGRQNRFYNGSPARCFFRTEILWFFVPVKLRTWLLIAKGDKAEGRPPGAFGCSESWSWNAKWAMMNQVWWATKMLGGRSSQTIEVLPFTKSPRKRWKSLIKVASAVSIRKHIAEGINFQPACKKWLLTWLTTLKSGAQRGTTRGDKFSVMESQLLQWYEWSCGQNSGTAIERKFSDIVLK